MERFTLKPAAQEGWLICTDNENAIMCKFKKHLFNETQEFVIDEAKFEPITAETSIKIAHLVREMADWLRENHYYIAMPQENDF